MSSSQINVRPGARLRQTRTREALLAAARRLMVEGARAGFTVDELTGAAEVARGSFYNHFPDKQALAEEVHRAVREKAEAAVRSINFDIEDPVVRIARGMAVYARLALISPEDAHLLTLTQIDSGFLHSASNAGLRNDLHAALSRGLIAVPSIEAAALLVVGQTAILMARLRENVGPQEAYLLAQQCICLSLVGLGLSNSSAELICRQSMHEVLINVDDRTQLSL